MLQIPQNELLHISRSDRAFAIPNRFDYIYEPCVFSNMYVRAPCRVWVMDLECLCLVV